MTPRQKKILEKLCSSPDYQAQIAKDMGIHYSTFKRDMDVILRETGASSRLELLHMAINQKLAKCPFCGPKESV